MIRVVKSAVLCALLGACTVGYPSPIVIAPAHDDAAPVHVPPGHLPPPGPCGALRYRVPPGAYLIQG